MGHVLLLIEFAFDKKPEPWDIILFCSPPERVNKADLVQLSFNKEIKQFVSTEWIRRRSYQQGFRGVDDQVRGDKRRSRPETRVRDIKETEGRPRPPSDTGDRVPNR